MLEGFLTELPAERETAVALGVFDGVHRGHRAVLKEAVSNEELEPWVFTFAEESISKAKNGVMCLEPARVKFKIMKKCGISHVYAPNFDEVKHFSGEEFVQKVLVEHLKCRKVVCGTDFRFGRLAGWDAEDMRKFCDRYGMECCIVDKLYDDGDAISSTAIRAAVAEGNTEKVQRLCGYPFCIDGVIVSGKRLGRQHGLPTINQMFDENCIIPRYGVYASAVYINKAFFPGVTNVGVKPTVTKAGIPVAETNIVGFSADVYGKEAMVFLLDFMRPERKFKNEDELFEQIYHDRNNARVFAEGWIAAFGGDTERLFGER